MARFEKREPAFNNMLHSPRGLVGNYLKERGERLVRLASAQVGVKTGNLKRSINYEVRSSSSGLSVRVGSSNAVALMHHQGTKPHTIKPRYKKTLRFQQHGKIVYARIVHHPGTKPNRYLTDNLPKVIND